MEHVSSMVAANAIDIYPVDAQVEVDHVAERLDEFPELCALWEAHRKDENMPFGVRSGLIGLCMEVTRLVEGTRLVEPLPLDLSEFREVLSGK